MHHPQQKKKRQIPTQTNIAKLQDQHKTKPLKATLSNPFPPKKVKSEQQNNKRLREDNEGQSLKQQIKKQKLYPMENKQGGNPLPKILAAMQKRQNPSSTSSLQRQVTQLTQNLDKSSKNARTRGALRQIATSMSKMPTFDVTLTPNGKTYQPS